ncbi:solute carrier family 22 member 11-like isoform X2 [Thrips palmi]|uniref:Solute carrier family 22 member 11-like isoform X2 n=1 Tax=Thrips palmi TaxID=161013 RepID=A0A6P8YZC0_THRPL|nr:solute carrier family 22 member 11-like isoform X2 [Thrips palmi]
MSAAFHPDARRPTLPVRSTVLHTRSAATPLVVIDCLRLYCRLPPPPSSVRAARGRRHHQTRSSECRRRRTGVRLFLTHCGGVQREAAKRHGPASAPRRGARAPRACPPCATRFYPEGTPTHRIRRHEKANVKSDAAADFETAIDATGCGLFSYGILVTAGLIFLTSGLQNGINAYILPAAKCDFDLSSAQMGALNAFFLAGGMVSSYVWGILGDALGRRPVMVFALVADALCTLCSTLSQSYASFAAFRFVSGALIGGPASLAFLYVGEFVPARKRTSYSLIVGGFWTVSWIILPGLAWLVLPQPWEVRALGLTFNSWRVMLSLIAAPTLVSAALAMRFPETPKFLMSQGRLKEALAVLTGIYVTNTGRAGDEYPIASLALAGDDSAGVAEVDAAPELSVKSVAAVARRKLSEAMTLFRVPVLARTALVCAIVFANMFSYYGLVLWLPELFNRFEVHYALHPDQTTTVCQLSQTWAAEQVEMQQMKMNSTSIEAAEQNLTDAANATSAGCNAAEAVNEAVFLKTLIISGVCLVANVVAALLAPAVGRRALPLVLNVASGALAAAIYFVDSTTGNLVVASLFQALVGNANTAINGFMVDIFPPRVSAFGVCSAILAGRVGAAVSNLVLGSLLDISCEVPIFLIAGTVIVGGVLCIFVQPPWSNPKDEEVNGSMVLPASRQEHQQKSSAHLTDVQEPAALPV